MRVKLMRVLLPMIIFLGLTTAALGQDYTFNVRVKLDNISTEVNVFSVTCHVCKFETATVTSCVQPGANTSTTPQPATGTTILGVSQFQGSLGPSSTTGPPKSYDNTVAVNVTLATGWTRSDVSSFSCYLTVGKNDQAAYLIGSPQNLPVWARPDLNKPFTAIITGGL